MPARLAGTIGLVYTGGGLAGSLVRIAQEGHWNHVVIAKGNGQLYSAEPRGGVQLRPDTYWPDTVWLEHEPLETAQGEARAAFCETQLGMPYNWPAILAFSRWWIPVPHFVVAWANRRHAVICSELAALAADSAGTPWFPLDLPRATVAPSTIDVLFRRKGW